MLDHDVSRQPTSPQPPKPRPQLPTTTSTKPIATSDRTIDWITLSTAVALLRLDGSFPAASLELELECEELEQVAQ